MKKALCIVFALIIAFSCFTCAFAAGTKNVTVEVKYHQTEARSLLARINALRTGSDAWYWNKDNVTKTVCSGLAPLEYDYDLEKAAMQRAAEITVSFSHLRPNGERCFTAYSGSTRAENIAMGHTSADMVQTAWEEANEKYDGQGHRRNMLNSSITAVGIACAEYNGIRYWVQEFRNPTGSTVETVAIDGAATVTVVVPDDGGGSSEGNEGKDNNQGGEGDEAPEEANWFTIIIGFFRTVINFFIMLASILK